MSQRACLKGAFHRSLTVLVCYRFPLQIIKQNHKYLAFDVSLPPPNYLSCSPKQLDSETKVAVRIYETPKSANVAVTL
jgi:hypothetical protein